MSQQKNRGEDVTANEAAAGLENPADLLDEARGELQRATALRRTLHRHPELGLRLPITQREILASLDEIGIAAAARLGKSLDSVSATIEGERPGPTILLRADMDALPLDEDTGLEFTSARAGAMHACGHDAHVAMLLGAARLLHRRRGAMHGRVRLMFQPGEEACFGARHMIEEGVLDGDPPPAFAFAIHITPSLSSGAVALRAGPLLASYDDFAITVRGRGGHASMPHDALDPIPVACEIVQAMQTYVTRRINVFEPAVVTVGQIVAGTTENVIPEIARMTGTIRTVAERTRRQIRKELRPLVEGIARAHGAEATMADVDGYPVTVNHASAAREVLAIAGRLFGAERALNMPTPFMGAEDFSYVLERIPGAMAFLGAQPDGVSRPPPNHSNRMVLDEAALASGIALHAAMAMSHLRGT